MLDRLELPSIFPAPDGYNTFWLRYSGKAAIFQARNQPNRGKYHCCDVEGMPLTDGPGLRYFDTPQEALEFMRARVL